MTAALHAGALEPGETKLIKVYIRGPQRHLKKSLRNGIQSHRYTDFPCSFTFEEDVALDVRKSKERRKNIKKICVHHSDQEAVVVILAAYDEFQVFCLNNEDDTNEPVVVAAFRPCGDSIINACGHHGYWMTICVCNARKKGSMLSFYMVNICTRWECRHPQHATRLKHEICTVESSRIKQPWRFFFRRCFCVVDQLSAVPPKRPQ